MPSKLEVISLGGSLARIPPPPQKTHMTVSGLGRSWQRRQKRERERIRERPIKTESDRDIRRERWMTGCRMMSSPPSLFSH